MRRLFTKSKSPPSKSPAPISNNVISHTPALQPKFVVPPVPHPRPHEHIAILPTEQGLLLRPHVAFGEQDHHIRITWGKVPKVEEIQDSGQDVLDANWTEAVVVYGIIGILELFTESYLLVITARSDVGHFLDESRKIYAVRGVSGIPLSGLDRATSVTGPIARNNAARARMSLLTSPRQGQQADDDVDAPDGAELRVKFSDQHQVKVMSPAVLDEFTSPDRPPSPASLTSSGASSVSSESPAAPVAKTLAERMSFWTRLSKRQQSGPTNEDGFLAEGSQEEAPPLDSLIHEGMGEPQRVLTEILETTAPTPTTIEEKHSELEAKILRQMVKEFAKGEMFFAHDFDITRSLQNKQDQIAKSQKQNALLADLNALEPTAQSVSIGEKIDALAEPSPALPLWRRVDRQFWWNENLSKPLVDAGLHSYILPLVQGFFQVASFSVPQDVEWLENGDSAHVDYVIMSRRSRDRAGLRFQRRGVDDDAHVANFVETETITRIERERVTNIFSYVQIRGSIPLFWTQSGSGLKPAPQLSPDVTHQQNLQALTRHFKRTVPAYGPHTIVNLAEQQGKEGAVTNAYREYIEEVKLPDVKYCQYDFHAETKGMKYENISKLIDQLERSFEAQGFLWISDQLVLSRQKGVYRVNCIDCLDRTNVVQSAFARHVLNRQLLALALLNPSDHGRTDMDVVFNDVWANNGDAISRCYAGTSALKGDFTRTGKRDLGGLLNDGMNSLARMYTSTFSDWFCQAVIDYMLGFRTLSVFSEFLLKLQSTDPRELIRLSKIRTEAIATCVSRVLEDGERLLSGWTLFSPTELNTKLGDKFEEKVLLLSVTALYIISYDYNLEKVKVSTRIPLRDIVGITKGAYIVSPLEEASRDPVQNAGFTIEWRNARQMTRVTSYSVRNSIEIPSSPIGSASPTRPSKFTGRPSTSPPARPSVLAARPSAPASTPTKKPPAPVTPSSSPPTAKRRPPPLARTPTASRLSRLLSNTAPPPLPPPTPGSPDSPDTPGTSFAAFKALPIEPARSSGELAPNELAGAATCREAVERMVSAIARACAEAGGTGAARRRSVEAGAEAQLVRSEDIVSLAEARKMTSVYAKMEYGVKRLLWLGG
ncbi:SacI homology domain-containing protein [Gloeopeniophorella convolvens]|nr:SacI homology domain-containing protein [Gloeopeniophorella convolvens]